MNKKFFMLLLVSLFFLGAAYFILTHGWIIFRYPSYKTESNQTARSLRAGKRNVTLFFWHNNKWNKERVDVLETNDAADTVAHVVNSWLTLLEDDQVMSKKVSVQSAMLSPNKQLYLSFDRNPFNKQNATYKKWMWIEGLLKTIRENKLPVQSVRLLVHHQPLQDYHLDFSQSWPLSGFLYGTS